MVARFKNAGEVLEVPLPVRFRRSGGSWAAFSRSGRPFGRRGGEGRQRARAQRCACRHIRPGDGLCRAANPASNRLPVMLPVNFLIVSAARTVGDPR
jgi:hypothetical protein